MIFYGTHKFGWVDQVDGAGCVATRFFHIMWIPLFPLGSTFLLESDSDRGFSMSLSWKSVLVAYVRAFLFWSAAASWVGMAGTMGLSCCTAVPLTIAYLAMPLLVRKASAERAAELRAQFGL